MQEYLKNYRLGDHRLTLEIITLCRYFVAFGLLEEQEINDFFQSLYKIFEDRTNEQNQYVMVRIFLRNLQNFV